MVDFHNSIDDAHVNHALRGRLEDGEYLEPRLWEPARLKLQSMWRRATGEPQECIYTESALSQAIREARRQALEDAANVAYRTCAETRHVTLGDKCATAIRQLMEEDQ